MTKYYIGIIFAVHLIATTAVLLSGNSAQQEVFGTYLLCALPLAIADLMIRQVALAAWKLSSLQSTSIWRAVALVFFTWPVYTLAWVMALLRLPLRFHATPKEMDGELHPVWILPQVISCVLVIYGLLRFRSPELGMLSLVPGFALIQVSLQAMVLAQRLRPSRLRSFAQLLWSRFARI
jgi:hypothetical protein